MFADDLHSGKELFSQWKEKWDDNDFINYARTRSAKGTNSRRQASDVDDVFLKADVITYDIGVMKRNSMPCILHSPTRWSHTKSCQSPIQRLCSAMHFERTRPPSTVHDMAFEAKYPETIYSPPLQPKNPYTTSGLKEQRADTIICVRNNLRLDNGSTKSPFREEATQSRFSKRSDGRILKGRLKPLCPVYEVQAPTFEQCNGIMAVQWHNRHSLSLSRPTNSQRKIVGSVVLDGEKHCSRPSRHSKSQGTTVADKTKKQHTMESSIENMISSPNENATHKDIEERKELNNLKDISQIPDCVMFDRTVIGKSGCGEGMEVAVDGVTNDFSREEVDTGGKKCNTTVPEKESVQRTFQYVDGRMSVNIQRKPKISFDETMPVEAKASKPSMKRLSSKRYRRNQK